MTEDEREELIEQMANKMFASKQYNGCFTLTDMACAALAVAEPVIREQCAEEALKWCVCRPAEVAAAIRDSRNCVPEGGKDEQV